MLFVADITFNKSLFKSTLLNASLSISPTMSLTLSLPNTKAKPIVAPSLIKVELNNSLTKFSNTTLLFNLSKSILSSSKVGLVNAEEGNKLNTSTALTKILPN